MRVARKKRGQHFAAPIGNDWTKVGASIIHSTFGTGMVVSVGLFRGARAVWIDFDRGDRMALDPETAADYMRVRGAGDQLTPPEPRLRCDVCSERPVVAMISDAGGTVRLCETHRESYQLG